MSLRLSKGISLTTASLAAAVACFLPPPVVAQDILAPPRLELRGGLAWHGAGGCLRNGGSGLAAGVDVRTSGRLILSATGDLFLHSYSCLDVGGLVHVYQGQQVETSGSPTLGPRIAAAMGYAIPIGNLGAEVTAGIGTIVTKTRYEVRQFDVSLRSWQGAALTLRFPNDLGVQLEIGRHRLAERYYQSTTRALVAELLRWERMVRVALSVPVAG